MCCAALPIALVDGAGGSLPCRSTPCCWVVPSTRCFRRSPSAVACSSMSRRISPSLTYSARPGASSGRSVTQLFAAAVGVIAPRTAGAVATVVILASALALQLVDLHKWWLSMHNGSRAAEFYALEHATRRPRNGASCCRIIAISAVLPEFCRGPVAAPTGATRPIWQASMARPSTMVLRPASRRRDSPPRATRLWGRLRPRLHGR